MKKQTARARHAAQTGPKPPATAARPDRGKAAEGSLLQRIDEALARGTRLLRAGRAGEAVAAFDEVLAILPDHGETLINRGVALRRAGRRDEALASYWRALEVAGDKSAVWVNAANALADAGRIAEAHAALGVARRRLPQSADVWQGLANLLLKESHELAAEACLRRAAALSVRDATPLVRLASLLAQRGRLDSALASFDDARRLGPLTPGAHSGYAQTLISQGRLAEAERHLRRALEIDRDHLDAHLGLARLLLLKGELETGWVEYEWRRKKPESKLPKLRGKEWDGSSLAGKTLLVYSEQGFGDVLQFVRYVPILARQGARIILAVPAPLERLMQGLEGAAQVVTSFRALPPIDFHVPLLTIPRLTGISLASLPAPRAYLKPPAAPVPLPAPLGTRLKVGIVWAGSPKHSNDRNRSLTIETLLPLANVRGVALYSLQAGPRVGDIAKFAHPALVQDLSRHLRDFADTAAVVAQLDLVVCADTAVAHLAAAMGKPVWVLMPFAPDWRWLLEREDTPWYPIMRLFRQGEPGRWDEVTDRVVAELARLVANRPELGSQGEVPVHSAFMREDGAPRFRMVVPRAYLGDPGLRFLVERERAGTGYEFATRCFIDGHLQPGDLFLDVGAHWGIMSLHAATRFQGEAGPGEVRALAFEPAPGNVQRLREWLGMNGLADQVEVVAAAVAEAPGRGALRPESTMGYSLVRSEEGRVPVVTVDGALAERPHLQRRRVIAKIDVEGGEPEVVAGMGALLASGRVAAVIWERGTSYDQAGGRERVLALRRVFAELGFTAWRFASEDEGGALEPFVEDGWNGNVFELAPGLAPLPRYGAERLPAAAQPPDAVLDAMNQAGRRQEEGRKLQAAGKVAQALAAYAESAAIDMRQPDLYNNLGVALRGDGRLAAAEASYRRALALQPGNAGGLSNLGNLLRERGKMREAEQAHRLALARRPEDARLLYNAGLVPRDDHRPAEAQIYFERSLAIEPENPDCRWDAALVQLQQGDYAHGFPGYESRWGLKRSPPRRIAMQRWTGEPLGGRSIFLHDEQGFGDVLMFARFIAETRRRGAGKIVLECQPELMRLMALTPGIDQVIRRGSPTPSCHVYAPLLSLPGLFGTTLETLPNAVPYLGAPAPELPLPSDERLKMGIVWAGKTTPRDRSIPLELLLPLLGDPRYAAWSLQIGPRAADLKKTGADALVFDMGPRLVDFAETAAVLKGLDLLVTIDTATAHLAGALGVPTFMLLLYTSDWRWFDAGEASPWYPTMRLFRQTRPNRWDEALEGLAGALDAFANERRGSLPGLPRL